MAGYIFLGRQRHPLKILLFQLLTLGIYGRVYLYKILREFDGHEALFLDRRPYIPLLILPFVGPLIVKQKVTAIAADLIHHDVTTPRFKPGRLRLLAWLPLVPLFHMELQRVLNHHWGMHGKELELELKRAQLAPLQRSRTPEAAKAAQVLAKDIAQREKELDDVRQASLALREAEQVRLEAEREAGGRRGSTMALVRKLGAAATSRLPRRGSDTSGETEEAVESLPETEEPEPTRRGKAPEPEPEPEPDAVDTPPLDEDAVEASEAEEAPASKKARPEMDTVDEAPAKKSWMSFVPFLGKKGEKEPSDSGPKKSEKEGSEKKPPVQGADKKAGDKKGGVLSFLPFLGKKSAKAAADKGGKAGKPGKRDKKEKAELSRAERKALKQKEKEKAKAAKAAAKEKKQAAKAAANEAKRATKEAAKEAKAKAKAEKKAAKEKAKAEAAAAKEKEKAAEKKKGKGGNKKEKTGAKGSAKPKAAKPKSRPK